MGENMNVLLISPPRENPQPASFPPIGLGYIAAVLKQDGHKFDDETVTIYDKHFSKYMLVIPEPTQAALF